MAKVETSVTELKLNKLTKEQYDSIAEPSNTELYFVTDEPISYNDLADKPDLKPVATSGSYDDLNNKPVFNGVELNNTNAVCYGVSTTAAATAEKEVSIPSITQLKEGQVIIVQPTVESTVANSTLKLNNFAAYPMLYNNAAITTSTDSVVWSNKYPSAWVFNGTYWVFLAHGVDSNTTYTMNYNCENGRYTSGLGTYAISRYSLVMQKPDFTWEKITDPTVNYTTEASIKNVNTHGFLFNQIRYYYTTTTYGNGQKVANNYFYDKYSSINMKYCTSPTPGWAQDDYIYLVGTKGHIVDDVFIDDGLFYLDSTQWWTNKLPNTNDGKYYIRLGLATSGYQMSLFYNHPVFYHNGEKLCEYLPGADNKQDKLVSGTSIKTINNTSLLDSGNISTNDLLPDQTNNSGKFLTTDGTDISWASVDAFPSQSGNSGKFLMTDGSVVSWEQLATVATSGSYTDLSNKPTIEDLTTTAQQNALNSGATSTLIGKISTNESAITTINGKIPSAASSSNQLADKDFVNSTVTTLLARYITSSASGDSFATNAALLAGPYYLDGTAVATLDLHNNDYTMVMEDETHDNKPARYIWSGTQWSFQYVLNNTTFTQAQVDAMNSTITHNLVNTYNTHVANNDIHVTTTDKNTWNAKQNAITGAATTITNDNLTSNRAIISNGSGKVAVSDTTSTELGYVHGVTSSIQTQLNSKAADSNTVHKTGNETIAGYKTFTDPTTTAYLTVNPLNDSPTSKEGGEIRFVGASGEVNAGKAMYIDRCNGSLRLYGYDSSGTVHVQLQADAEHNTLYGVTPTEDTTSSRQIDTVGARNTKLLGYQPLLAAGTGIEIDGTNNINIIQLDKTYTEIGPINQSSEGVYFGFSNTAYVRLALGFTDDFSNGSGIFRVKIGNSLAGIQPILCDTATTQRVIGMVDGVPTFYNVENIVQLSATPLSTNTWYWFAITADENGDIYYSCIVDNDYTIETLPPFSQWTIYTFILHDDFLNVLANTSLQVGKDFWNHVWLGEVDLKDSVAIVDNVPVWGYVDLGTVPAKASVDKFGLVRPDDTTITINDGIISYKNTNGYWTKDDVQNYRDKYITNCVTTLPDNIKLELKTVDNVNTLVLKAGSKIYVPNGTNIYNEVSVESDRSYTINSSGQAFVYTNATGTMVSVMGLGRCSSGDTDSLAGTAWHIWYDTANNVIKKYDNDASTVAYTCAFPLALVTISGTSLTIDRIFNGIGFIGSKVFATPGVTVLIPNGRNEDGTLINIEKTTTNVSTYTAFNGDFVINYNGTIAEVFNVKYKEGETLPTDLVSGFWYNTRENKVYRVTNNVIRNQEKVAVCCHITTDGNQKATNIDYKYPFRGTDYYDFKNLESKVDTNDSNVVHKTGNETIAGNKTFTYYAKLASGTIFTKQGGQPSIEGGEFHFEKGDSDTTIYNYVVEDLYGGKVRFFGTCNKDGGGTEIRHPLAVNFTNNRIDTPSVYINGTLQNDVGTTSKFVPTIGWVNNSTSGVNNIVHKTGEEVIAGIKRFTDLVSLKNIFYSLFDNTASSKYLYYNDKDGHATGWVESRINHGSVAGESRLRLFAETYTDNTFTTGITACVDVVANPDGTIYATAPTPSSVTDDSTKIATTHWVNLYMSNAVYTKTEQDVMLAEKADVDLSNSTRLTNCILDIPQDVKITLSADKKTAYVEAGTVMYYADGFEQDGTTKKFTKIILNSRRAIGIDPITTGTAPGYFPIVFRYNQNSGNGIFWANVPFDYCVSGSTNPGNRYEWYDTTNNIEGYTINGALSDRSTFPIGMLYRDEDNNLTICEVYNGFGYIGSSIYAVPGIKYLMPDGLQTGGQLKTIENTTSVLSVVSNPDTADATQVLLLDSSGLIQRANVWISSTTKPIFTENYTQLWFNPDTNLVYSYRDSSTQSYINACLVGRFTHNDSTKITDFSTRNAFIAADYNELDGFVEDKILELGYRPTLFAHEWDDKLRNDVQWLRGDTFSWQDGKVYKAAYKHLYDEWASGYTIKTDVVAGHTLSYRLAADGHKIVPAAYESVVAAIYEDTGIAWYYIIDTTNKRFKLPRDNHAANRVLIKTLELGAGWARIYSDGWVEQGGKLNNSYSGDVVFAIPMADTSYHVNLTLITTRAASSYDKERSPNELYTNKFTVNNIGGSASTGAKWEVKGYGNTNYLKNISTQFDAEYKYLYFYVGKYTQSALLNTAGMKTETVNDKADRNLLNSVPTAQFAQLLLDAGIDTVIESQLPTAENNYTWYRKYKSGWVEQGGSFATVYNDYHDESVVLPITMSNSNYTCLISISAGGNARYSAQVDSKTTTGFIVHHLTNITAYAAGWQVSGMAAN